MSTDDHVIEEWEWTKGPKDSGRAVDMQVYLVTVMAQQWSCASLHRGSSDDEKSVGLSTNVGCMNVYIDTLELHCDESLVVKIEELERKF